MPPPPPHTHTLPNQNIFVNGILYQNVLFVVFCARGGWGGGGCQKAQKPINGLSSIICNVSRLWEYTVYVCST